MNQKELQNIISKGENQQVEFKTSFSDAVIETLVAFSNTNGGVVLIGVSDENEIKGVQTGKETTVKWINEIKNKTTPSLIADIDIVELIGFKIVVLTVIEYPIKPISFKGKYFKRVANSNHLLSVDEILMNT